MRIQDREQGIHMKQKKRAILIGRSMAGKTTLCQFLYHEELKYHKTQTVQLINDSMIDTPGGISGTCPNERSAERNGR